MTEQSGVTVREAAPSDAGCLPAPGCSADGGVAVKVAAARLVLVGSLDAVVLVCKLLVIEAKLIHEGGCHLLDLVLGESLGETGSQGRPQAQAAPHS